MLRGIDPSLVRQNLNNILKELKKKINVLLAGMLSQNTLGQEYKNNFDKIYPELLQINIKFLIYHFYWRVLR